MNARKYIEAATWVRTPSSLFTSKSEDRNSPSRRGRRLLAAAGVATSLAVSGALAAPAHAADTAAAKPAAASAWHTKSVTATWCLGDSRAKLGGYHGANCFLAMEQVTATFAYNGSSVWQHSVDCGNDYTWPYSVNEKWCGYWNNGGSFYGYMNVGTNFKIETSVGSYRHYFRINCDANGRVWVSGG